MATSFPRSSQGVTHIANTLIVKFKGGLVRSLTAMLITSLTFASLPAMAKEADVIPLAKTSKWDINYSDDSCQLIRTFGIGAQQVFLRLVREQPGDSFSLELIGHLLQTTKSEIPVELTFGLDGTPFKSKGVAMTLSNAELPLVRFPRLRFDQATLAEQSEPIPPVTLARETAVTAIAFKRFGGKRYRLDTGSMGPPMAAMRTCTDDLIKTWGYDPAIQSRLRQRAIPTASPATWFHEGDFPNKAMIAGHDGLVRFRLDVDAAGIPQGCRALYRTSPDEFTEQTCKLLIQRARFLPALDSTGRPVKSFYINDVRWISRG